jgi:hypothetical protein
LIFITHVKPLTKLKSITWIILSHSLQQSWVQLPLHIV